MLKDIGHFFLFVWTRFFLGFLLISVVAVPIIVIALMITLFLVSFEFI